MNSSRLVPASFGLLMAAAAAVGADGWALIAAAIAAIAVLAGLYLPSVATGAVLAAACAIALCEPQPMLAALSGLAGAAYLVSRHTTMTRPTAIGLVGFAAVGIVAVTVPGGPAWSALLAAPTVVIAFAVVIAPYAGAGDAEGTTGTERAALGYE